MLRLLRVSPLIMSAVARHCHNPTEMHWKVVLGNMAYLDRRIFGIDFCAGLGGGFDSVSSC